MKLSHLLWVTLPLSLTACRNKSAEQQATDQRTVFFDKAYMDSTVRPGDNFFLYAGGNWLKKTEIPPSETVWGSFYSLADENQKNIKKILEEVSVQKNTTGSLAQKVGDLYLSGMDTLQIEKLGYSPIKPLLDKIEAVTNYKDLLKLVIDQQKEGNSFLIAVGVGPDDKISDKNAVGFYQAGLGLPNRDYYFNKDAATQKIRQEYVRYMTRLFRLIGSDPIAADKQAEDIMKLETSIASSHLTPVELRDPIKNYNKFTVEAFQKQIPNVDLRYLLARLDLKTDTVLVGQPQYYRELNNLLISQPIAIWKAKIKFEALSDAASYLSKDFDNARFEFYGKVLSGQQQQKQRWKRVTREIDSHLGELLGQLYVARFFKPEAKERMLTLVNNLQSVYKSRIEALDWMSAETKARAIAKLSTFVKKIGYPDKWKKYDDVQIVPNAYFQNIKAISAHDFKEMFAKLHKPVDRTEWVMSPPTVNAYYNPSFNEIVFPAGILQFPFFDFGADDAINYGGIGAVIGHEMTHGFDDQGRQYDQQGNLKDWWGKVDADKFKAKTQAIVSQYSQYTVLSDLKVNGALTLGENIADIGGLAIAYQAFKMTPQGKSNEKIDGLTPDQRFFLSFAQVWRVKLRDQEVRRRINTDPHSPVMYRVNGSLSNMDAFYAAFDIKPGDKMYRPEAERVHVW